MFWFLQSQAAVGNSTCALDRGRGAQSEFKPGEYRILIGLVTLLAAIVGEAIADWQLRVFKKRPCEPKRRLRCRSLAMVPPSELFL